MNVVVMGSYKSKYHVHDPVDIRELERPGMVTAVHFDRDGMMYLVRYFQDGLVKSVYFYEHELRKATKKK